MSVLSSVIAKALADRELQKSAAQFAAERIDSAIRVLVGAAQTAYDRRGFRFCERFLRTAFLRDHWRMVEREDPKNRGAARRAARLARKALRWQAKCIAAPPVLVGSVWVSPCEVMTRCHE